MNLNNGVNLIIFISSTQYPQRMIKGLFTNLIPEEHIFDNFRDCTRWIMKHVEKNKA